MPQPRPLNYQAPPPRKRSRVLRALVSPIGVLVCAFFTFAPAFQLSEWFVLRCAYGPERYAAGLRFARTSKHLLNDGTRMSSGVEFLHGIGTFLIVAAVIVTYMLIANALGLYWEGADEPEGDNQTTRAR
jgi:hypothetical protein